MATIDVKDAANVTQTLERPLTPGQKTSALSRPVVIASDQSAVPVSGTVTANVGTGTQPISGTVAATQSGAWNIAAITTLPALPAGTNNIGDVDIVTMPAVTVNGIPSTAATRGAGAADANTLRMTVDTGQLGTLVNGAVPVVQGGLRYVTVVASTAEQALEYATGAGTAGDILDHLVCTVSDPTNCTVQVRDGGASFSPGHVVLPNNIAAGISIQHVVLGGEAFTGPWYVGTGSGVSVLAFGFFSG